MTVTSVPQETVGIQPIERPKLRLMLRIGGFGSAKNWREEADVFVDHAFKLAMKGRTEEGILELNNAILASKVYAPALALSIEARRESWLLLADYSPGFFRREIVAIPTDAMLIGFLGKVMDRAKEDIEVSTAQFVRSEDTLNVTTLPTLERLLDVIALARKRLEPGHTGNARILLTELATKFYNEQLRYASDILDKMPDTDYVAVPAHFEESGEFVRVYDDDGVRFRMVWQRSDFYVPAGRRMEKTHARKRAEKLRDSATQFHKCYLERET